MADSVGSGFPSTGINKGHVFYDFDESSVWLYLGGIPRLASSWVMLYGRLSVQPDTSLWAVLQAGAIWFLTTDGNYYGWNGSAIVLVVTGSNASLYDYSTSVKMQDDFISGTNVNGSIGALGWTAFGGTSQAGGSDTNNPGLIQRDTSAVSGTVAYMILSGSQSIIFPQLIIDETFIVRANVIDAFTSIRSGITSNAQTSPPSNGIYFEKADADVNWFAVTRKANVETRTDTLVAVISNFVKFRIVKNGTSSVLFYLNNVLIATHITNIMVGSSIPFCHIANSNAVSKTLDIDYFEMIVTGLVR
jgi:hypothetical protein